MELSLAGRSQDRGCGQYCGQSASASDFRRAQRAVHTVRLRALSLVPLHFLTATQVYAALSECEAEWGEEQGLSR